MKPVTLPISVRLLGPFETTVSDSPVPLGGPKQRAVMAALILAGGRVVSSASLANAAWDEHPPVDYTSTLHVFIANLRKSLRQAGLEANSVIRTVAPGYRVMIVPEAIDYGRFVGKCSEAQNHLHQRRYDDARQAFRAALTEFSGDVLADLRGLRFADDFAALAEEERIEAFTALMEAEINCGRAKFVINELSAAVRDHPLHEPLWAQLITALHTLGRQTDALDACRRIRANLADELGIDPGPALADLELKVLRQEQLDPAVSFTMPTTISDHSFSIEPAQLRDPEGQVTQIPAKGLRIGRKPDNDLVLTDPKASRYHASINRTIAGYVIRDLRSANGVRVADQQVFDAAVLSDGDSIEICSQTWVFEHVT